MEGAAVVADVPALTGPSMSYNISLNLTSIFSFLPSRLLARLRKGVTVLDQPVGASDISATTTADILSQEQPLLQTTPPSNVTAYPGPWGFFTSGYMMGLFLMAILLHRMQNIIIPSRVPASPALNRRGRRTPRFAVLQKLPFLRRMYNSMLPLNFGSTSTRLALHLPSMYFLCKVLVLWFVLVLQASNLFPEISTATAEAWGLSWIHRLGSWSQEKEMSEICWTTFCAVCAAFSVEGFVKALDGIGTGFPIGGNINPNTSPFNLVGYAFLLHIYSNPVTHIDRVDGLPTRPDKHVIITIGIPLLQLTIFHALSIFKRLSTHRLIPTTLTSLLSLIHFHGTLTTHYYKLKYHPSSPTPTQVQDQNARQLTTMQSLTSTYPLLNYIPNIFETALIATILLTVVLNTLVQILVRGRVERVFSGLGLGLVMGGLHDNPTHEESGGGIRAFFRSLPHDEDFGVLLLRVGTASLEATGLRGWGNEVAPVPAPLPSRPKRGLALGGVKGYREYGVVSMGRVGVGTVQSGFQVQGPTSARRRGPGRTAIKPLRGLENEVRNVDLGNDTSRLSASRPRGWWEWVREVARFFGAMWGVLAGAVGVVWFWVLDRAKGRKGRGRNMVERHRARGEEEKEGEEGEGGEVDAGSDHEGLYERFLRGESISDDEDDEVDGAGEEGAEDVDDEDDEEIDRENEALALFTDLIQSGEREGHHGEMVLAHLAHGFGTNRTNPASASGSGTTAIPSSTGPLTRQKWRDLLSIGAPREFEGGLGDLSDDDDDDDAASNVRGAYDDDGKEMERELDMRHVCVVCTIEARDIICWPCRCLAMCDGCREALASRSAPTKHRCPCCRQIIDGYSRIYIP